MLSNVHVKFSFHFHLCGQKLSATCRVIVRHTHAVQLINNKTEICDFDFRTPILHSWEWPGTGIPAHPWTTFTQLLHWFLNSSWHCVIDIFEACKACSALQTLIVQLTMSIPRYSFIWGHRKCPGSHHLTALSFKLQPNNELPAFVLFQPLQCSIHLAAFLVIVMMPWLALLFYYFTVLCSEHCGQWCTVLHNRCSANLRLLLPFFFSLNHATVK